MSGVKKSGFGATADEGNHQPFGLATGAGRFSLNSQGRIKVASRRRPQLLPPHYTIANKIRALPISAQHCHLLLTGIQVALCKVAGRQQEIWEEAESEDYK